MEHDVLTADSILPFRAEHHDSWLFYELHSFVLVALKEINANTWFLPM